MQQKSISIGLFILSMLGAYLLLSMLTIFVNNSAHGDSIISQGHLKESFSESALLVESLPKPCDSSEVEDGKACIGIYLNSSDKVTTSILTAGGNVEQSVPISGAAEDESSSPNQTPSATPMADEEANMADRQEDLSSEQEESAENASQQISDQDESPCVYVANNLYAHDTNDEDEISAPADQEVSEDDTTQYVWIDPDQPDIEDEHVVNSSNGLCVELYRDNGDGIASPSDDLFVGFTLMMDEEGAKSGSYQFTNLADGAYFAKFYPLGAPVAKLEKVIKTPTRQPVGSPSVDIMSDEVMIESETEFYSNTTEVNDGRLTDTNTDVGSISSENATNRNHQTPSQNNTQSNSRSSTSSGSTNNLSVPTNNNSNPTPYNQRVTPTVYNQPATPTAYNQPVTPTVYNQRVTPTVYNQRVTPTVYNQPATPTAYNQPATPTPYYQSQNNNNGIEANTSDSTEYSQQNGQNSHYITVSPTAEPTVEVYNDQQYNDQQYNDHAYSESSDDQSQDLSNQSVSETYEDYNSTYSDSESVVESNTQAVNSNNDSADQALSSIKIQIDPSNPDSSWTSGVDSSTSDEGEWVDETNTEPNQADSTNGSTGESNNDPHQVQPVEPNAESTPYPAPDETSSQPQSNQGLSSTSGIGISIGSEVGSAPASPTVTPTP